MLPIRLGMANSKGTQELYIFTLTAEGLVESTNYRTVKLPTNVDLPHAVESNFSSFYRSLFDYQFEQYDKRAIFMEYGGDINRCDPCIADALTEQQQRELGVFWLKPKKNKWSATAVYITRLHLRYDNAHFPDDLVFQETKNQQRTIFQLRYVIREPTNKGLDCDNGFAYVNHELPLRYETEAGNLAELTGEDINLVRKRLNLPQQPPGQKSFWNIVKQGLK